MPTLSEASVLQARKSTGGSWRSCTRSKQWCKPLLDGAFRAIVVILFAAAALTAHAQAIYLKDSGEVVTIPADGKSVTSITLQAMDKPSVPGSNEPVSVTLDKADAGKLVVTAATASTNADGVAQLVVASGKSAGTAAVHVKIGAITKDVAIKLVAAGADPDVQQIIACVSTFILFMILISMGAEKGTDILKQFIAAKAPPRPTLASVSGLQFTTLVTGQPTESALRSILIMLHAGKVDADAVPGQTQPATEADLLKLTQQIVDLDRNHQRWSQSQTTLWRVLSGILGGLIAWMLHLDLGDILKPIVSPDTQAVISSFSYLLIGIGASAGAAFWSDFLDKLTAAKRQAEGAAPKPAVGG